jgi:hypothetical protein
MAVFPSLFFVKNIRAEDEKQEIPLSDDARRKTFLLLAFGV